MPNITSKLAFDYQRNKHSQYRKIAEQIWNEKIESVEDLPTKVRQAPSLSIHFWFEEPDNINRYEDYLLSTLMDYWEYVPETSRTTKGYKEEIKYTKEFLKGKLDTMVVNVQINYNRIPPEKFVRAGGMILRIMNGMRNCLEKGGATPRK